MILPKTAEGQCEPTVRTDRVFRYWQSRSTQVSEPDLKLADGLSLLAKVISAEQEEDMKWFSAGLILVVFPRCR